MGKESPLKRAPAVLLLFVLAFFFGIALKVPLQRLYFVMQLWRQELRLPLAVPVKGVPRSALQDSWDRVAAGDTLGYVGNTGNAAGGPCHLHYGIYRNGAARDPYPLLSRHERRPGGDGAWREIPPHVAAASYGGKVG